MAQSIYEVVATHLNARDVLLFASASWVFIKIVQALYNVSPLHPLSRVPGPLLARATYWPEFWHDVVLGGRFTHAIKKMHDEYGSQVSIPM